MDQIALLLLLCLAGLLLMPRGTDRPEPITILIAQEPIQRGSTCFPLILLAVLVATLFLLGLQ